VVTASDETPEPAATNTPAAAAHTRVQTSDFFRIFSARNFFVSLCCTSRTRPNVPVPAWIRAKEQAVKASMVQKKCSLNCLKNVSGGKADAPLSPP
jgi:hypothetical protein